MKKIITIFTLLILSLGLVSCKNNKQSDIITSSYFQYDIVKNIVGNKLSYELLTPPGVEMHDFEPSSKQIIKIKKSQLFIFTSYKIDTWLNNDVEATFGKINFLNLQEKVDNDDFHYWTNTLTFLQSLTFVKDEIVKLDPTNESFYEKNYENYYNKILNLHNEMKEKISSFNNNKIFFAGHNALQSFEQLYNLNITAISESNKPDSEIVSTQIKEMINNIKLNNAKYLFVEELSDLKVANTIKNELEKQNYNISLLELHSYHNLSKDDFNNNITYYNLLLRNFKNLSLALGDNNE